jgi:glycosyltransferase involved in cell wall biosynthesis
MGPTVVLSVVNDLHSDQRVHRTATLWAERGYRVVLVGRTYPNPAPLDRPYETRRMSCWVNRGPLFYLEFQVRLWFELKRLRPDVYLANDLDTLAPNAWWAMRRAKPLVYDSHEYFLGAPELESRPLVQRLWRAVERYGIPRSDFRVTVNQSIADQYAREYGGTWDVVRNVPLAAELPWGAEGEWQGADERKRALREELGLPVGKTLWILQGAGINVDRGAEELVEAAVQCPEVELLVVGSGDALPRLQQHASAQGWTNVRFVGRVPREQLQRYTQASDLGFSLDKPKSQNYRWSLPNKLFDYFQAGIPVVASDLVEVARVLRESGAGSILDELTPQAIVDAARALIQPTAYAAATRAARQAAHRYHWGHERAVWQLLVDRLEGRATHHIWSMDRLEPPRYGGTLEVLGQLRQAAARGEQVVLHAFTRSALGHANPFAEGQVNVLRRRRLPCNLLPWIVQSRQTRIARHQALVQRGTVTYHGLHCSGLSLDGVLRLHNPESAYYASLARQARGHKQCYYRAEAWALKRWERQLAAVWSGPVSAITPADADAWNALNPRSEARWVPPHHPFLERVPQQPATEPLVLAVGKFSVEENAAALRGLLAAQPPLEGLCFAGHNAPARTPFYVDRPSDEALDSLYARAQVVVVHAEHSLGIKFKLIQALLQGRHIVAHEFAVQGLDLGDRVVTYRTWDEAYAAIRSAQQSPWTAEHAARAREVAERFRSTPPKV